MPLADISSPSQSVPIQGWDPIPGRIGTPKVVKVPETRICMPRNRLSLKPSPRGTREGPILEEPQFIGSHNLRDIRYQATRMTRMNCGSRHFFKGSTFPVRWKLLWELWEQHHNTQYSRPVPLHPFGHQNWISALSAGTHGSSGQTVRMADRSEPEPLKPPIIMANLNLCLL